MAEPSCGGDVRNCPFEGVADALGEQTRLLQSLNEKVTRADERGISNERRLDILERDTRGENGLRVALTRLAASVEAHHAHVSNQMTDVVASVQRAADAIADLKRTEAERRAYGKANWQRIEAVAVKVDEHEEALKAAALSKAEERGAGRLRKALLYGAIATGGGILGAVANLFSGWFSR